MTTYTDKEKQIGGGTDYRQPTGAPHTAPHACANIHEFVRLNYFYGQMLGAADFQAEQAYFREKLKLHNRCLHGYGVVCGLRVVAEPQGEPCEPIGEADRAQLERLLAETDKEVEAARAAHRSEDELRPLVERRETLRRLLEDAGGGTGGGGSETPTRILVECGVALDCDGNELVVRRDLHVDLWKALTRQERATADTGKLTLYVSLCYCEQPVAPSRPVIADACGSSPDCLYGRTREGVSIHISTTEPDTDERCETCCASCREHAVDDCTPEPPRCVLLARIDNFERGKPLDAADIHNEVRRPVSIYVPTVITGISWVHAFSYTTDEATAVLNQMEVRFSRPVHASTIRRGVVELWVVEGGATRRAGTYSLEVDFDNLPPPDQTTDRLMFHYTGDEKLDPGDRVVIIVRTGHLLDKCCRPVNGSNVGGRVPLIDEPPYGDQARHAEAGYVPPPPCSDPHAQDLNCSCPPPGFGPWTSGAGGNFESWFFIPDAKSGAKR